MFIWKAALSTAIVGIIIGQFSWLAAGENVSMRKKKRYEKYRDILLESSDVPKAYKKKDLSRPWTRGIGPNGKPIEVDGFVQEFEFQDSSVTTRLKYGRFTNTNTADEAFTFHVTNVAAIFQSEPWPDVHLAKVPNRILFNSNNTSCAIALREGTTCILIICRGGSTKERRKKAVFFANKIIGRLRAARKDENK